MVGWGGVFGGEGRGGVGVRGGDGVGWVGVVWVGVVWWVGLGQAVIGWGARAGCLGGLWRCGTGWDMTAVVAWDATVWEVG